MRRDSLDPTDWTAFRARLDAHRDAVSRHFQAVFAGPQAGVRGIMDRICNLIWE